jgi:hypothetical protein
MLMKCKPVVDKIFKRKLHVEGVENESRVVGDELGVAAQVSQVHGDWSTRFGNGKAAKSYSLKYIDEHIEIQNRGFLLKSCFSGCASAS